MKGKMLHRVLHRWVQAVNIQVLSNNLSISCTTHNTTIPQNQARYKKRENLCRNFSVFQREKKKDPFKKGGGKKNVRVSTRKRGWGASIAGLMTNVGLLIDYFFFSR